MNNLRATGRSTRMIQKAIEVANTGKYVVVVCASLDHANICTWQCLELCRGKLQGPKVLPERGSISFETPATVRIDWERMTLVDAHPSCVLLVDHHAIEKHLSAALAMMHAFDPVTPPTGSQTA